MSRLTDQRDAAPAPPPVLVPALAARRRRRSSSLAAHGEPWVWLSGGALAVCVIMIIGLLLLIVVNGMSTFWPDPIVRIQLVDGRTVMGEVFRDEWYKPGDAAYTSLTPEQAQVARQSVKENEGQAHRRLIRTANFDLTETHFTWVSDFEIAPDGESQPQWAIIMERLAWGRFYGFPKSFEIDGKVMAEGEAATWAMFQKYHGEARSLFAQRRALEQSDIGEVNRVLEGARLRLREVQMEQSPPPAWVAGWRALNEIRTTGSPDDPQNAEAIKTAQESLAVVERDVGKPNDIFLQAVKDYEAAQSVGLEAHRQVTARIAALNKEMARYQIRLETIDGQVKLLAAADVVRAYPANQLGTGDRLGVFASRWWEFLAADPREANSEGGVFPAIFGTVAMTLIMSLLVVPFGVLAALYLREFAKGGLIVSAVRIAINNLAGVPSIVFGVFGLGFFCYGVGAFIDGGPAQVAITPWPPISWFIVMAVLAAVAVGAFFLSMTTFRPALPGQSNLRRVWLGRLAVCLWLGVTVGIVMLIVKTPLFEGFHRAKLPSPTFGTGGLMWASMTLALLTLPVVIVATEEALAAVPGSMREGSYACGASKWQTIKRIVLPRAMPGIMTGAILSMARGAGEVAPLMLVGAVKLAPELPIDSIYPFVHAERSFMHLGFHIYDLGFQSQNSEAAKPMVFTTTLLLIMIIVTLNVAAIALRARLRRKFVSGQF
ncbi:MAG: ABC transporter permease subunit [Phycisphaeraceae bacterium]